MQPSDVLTSEAAALAPHEQEMRRKAALLARVKLIRDAVNLQRANVTGDPDTEYLWVNLNKDRQLHFIGLGWEKVTADDTDVHTAYKQDDGTHVRGDLILYKMPKDLAQAHQDYNIIKGMEQIDRNKRSFETEASKLGAPTFTPKV